MKSDNGRLDLHKSLSITGLMNFFGNKWPLCGRQNSALNVELDVGFSEYSELGDKKQET